MGDDPRVRAAFAYLIEDMATGDALDCERYEGEQGLTGFFDEGIVVGKCRLCGCNVAFACTD